MADHIHYEVDDQVATITVDRPEKRNAMTYAVLGTRDTGCGGAPERTASSLGHGCRSAS